MNRIIITISLLLLQLFSFSQNQYGIGFGLSSAKCWNVTGNLFNGKNGFLVGYTNQLSNRKLKRVDVRLPNYGTTSLGSGTYFYTIDFGYSRQLLKKLSLGFEVSLGTEITYTNYSDNRFTGGGYYFVNELASLSGTGGYIIYHWREKNDINFSYNYYRGFATGIIFRFPTKH